MQHVNPSEYPAVISTAENPCICLKLTDVAIYDSFSKPEQEVFHQHCWENFATRRMPVTSLPLPSYSKESLTLIHNFSRADERIIYIDIGKASKQSDIPGWSAPTLISIAIASIGLVVAFADIARHWYG